MRPHQEHDLSLIMTAALTSGLNEGLQLTVHVPTPW